KTGTVTTGVMSVHEVSDDTGTVDGPGSADVLRIAGALEHGSEHPIARAVTAGARERGELPAVSGFANHPGLGVSGAVAGEQVVVGRPALLTDRGLAIPDAVAAAHDRALAAGHTAIMVGWDGRARGVVSVADRVKDSSPAAVAALRVLGLEPILLTGAHDAIARSVAAEAGIDHVVAHGL